MNIELMEDIETMARKRCGRSIKWLSEELKKAIADDMRQIDQWYHFENYRQVQRIINRMRPAQYFCPELKDKLDLLENQITKLKGYND